MTQKFTVGKLIAFNNIVYSYVDSNCEIFGKTIPANKLCLITSVRLESHYIVISILLKNKIYWARFYTTSNTVRYSKTF